MGQGKIFDKKDNYLVAKIFLEGGGLVVEPKYGACTVKWVGVPVILTCNKLDPVFRDPI